MALWVDLVGFLIIIFLVFDLIGLPPPLLRVFIPVTGDGAVVAYTCTELFVFETLTCEDASIAERIKYTSTNLTRVSIGIIPVVR